MNKSILLIDLETDGEVLWFESIQQAQSYIEPYDIDTCRVYTSEGEIIRIFIDKGQGESDPDKTRLEPSSDFDVETLRKALLRYLRSSKSKPKLDDHQPLQSLVELLKQIEKHS